MIGKIWKYFVITTAIIVFPGLFIRGFYLDHIAYKSTYNGTVVERYKGGRGSRVVIFSDGHNRNKIVFPPYDIDFLKFVSVGDSISKPAQSYFVSFYDTSANRSFKNSLELYHY